MKAVKKIKDNKQKVVKKPKVKTKKEKVLIVAQEIKFARLLSGNEKKTRDRVLKSLKKWLLNCFATNYGFKEDDFTRVWKGLFYAMWMSDKPLIQEDLCESIAGILDLFPADKFKDALLMSKAGFKILATEWYGIDHHRMDKFLMLVRRWLRGSLRSLSRCEWRTKECRMYADMLSDDDGILATKTPQYARNAGSMLLHVVDCFLEELAKVSSGDIAPNSVYELLVPMCRYVVAGESTPLCVSTRRLLTALLRQSDQGLEYHHKTKAWERMGCPRGGPDALELVSDEDALDPESEDEEEVIVNGSEKALDPRAGHVDVELATIPVPATLLAKQLKLLLASAGSKAHKRTKICLERFEQLARNEYPLKVKDVRDEGSEGRGPARASRAAAARRLQLLERALVHSADELALRGLSRRHRKKLLAKSRAGLSIVEDVPVVRPMGTSTNGNWEVDSTDKDSKKAKKTEDSSNKENVNRVKNATKRKHPDPKTSKQSKRQKSEVIIVKKDADKKRSYEKPTRNKQINKDQAKLVNGKHSPISNDNDKKKMERKLDDKLKLKENIQNKDKNDKKIEVKANDLKAVKEIKKNDKTKKIDLANTRKKIEKVTEIQKTQPKLLVNKLKNYQKKTLEQKTVQKLSFETPKKVKFMLKNNSMQKPVDYYKSVRQSPNIPFDSSKKPNKTNLKPSTPSPINPFFKKKLRLK